VAIGVDAASGPVNYLQVFTEHVTVMTDSGLLDPWTADEVRETLARQHTAHRMGVFPTPSDSEGWVDAEGTTPYFAELGMTAPTVSGQGAVMYDSPTSSTIANAYEAREGIARVSITTRFETYVFVGPGGARAEDPVAVVRWSSTSTGAGDTRNVDPEIRTGSAATLPPGLLEFGLRDYRTRVE
jgi:hypothetical protein